MSTHDLSHLTRRGHTVDEEFPLRSAYVRSIPVFVASRANRADLCVTSDRGDTVLVRGSASGEISSALERVKRVKKQGIIAIGFILAATVGAALIAFFTVSFPLAVLVGGAGVAICAISVMMNAERVDLVCGVTGILVNADVSDHITRDERDALFSTDDIDVAEKLFKIIERRCHAEVTRESLIRDEKRSKREAELSRQAEDIYETKVNRAGRKSVQ